MGLTTERNIMAQRANPEEISHPLHEAYACLPANGLDGAGEALRILVNEASRIERSQHLQAMPYERSAQRVDQANGYKSKTMLTHMGEITFEVPQVRSGGFLPERLERGSRSEQSVNLALAEMYVQGVSTRKVIEVLQKLVGPEVSISSTQISRCAEKLDVGLEAWRNRPLDETPYVLLDARYEHVREAGQVVDCAVLVAVGVIVSTSKECFVLAAKSLPGNPYDGHTLQACIEQATHVTGVAPQEAYADRGYKGHGCNTDTFKVWISGSKRGVTHIIERKLKRRNAVEPVIGHLKSDGRLARNFLKDVEGDAMNALLCGAGHNLRKIIRKLRLIYAFCGFSVRDLLSLILLPDATHSKPMVQFR